MDQLPPEQTESTAPQSSLMGRLVNVYAAPGEVFEEVRTSPPSNANWLVPALILILVSWLGAALTLSQESIKQQVRTMQEQAIQKQVDKGRMTQKQADAALQTAEKVGSVATVVGAAVSPVFSAFVSPVVWGLVIWLVGAKVLKGNLTYLKALEVAGLANMVGVLAAIVTTLLIMIMGNLFASPSLALLVKDFDPQNTAHSLLAMLNIMTLWTLTVRAIGLARLSGSSFAKAAAWLFGIWAAFNGLMIGLGLALRVIFRSAFGG